MCLDDWFLTRGERGNTTTQIDRRRGDGAAWTEGDRVEVLVDGAACFVERDDCELSTDWHEAIAMNSSAYQAPRAVASSPTSHDEVCRFVDCCGDLTRGRRTSLSRATRPQPKSSTRRASQSSTGLCDAGGSHHHELVIVRYGTGSDEDV